MRAEKNEGKIQDMKLTLTDSPHITLSHAKAGGFTQYYEWNLWPGTLCCYQALFYWRGKS